MFAARPPGLLPPCMCPLRWLGLKLEREMGYLLECIIVLELIIIICALWYLRRTILRYKSLRDFVEIERAFGLQPNTIKNLVISGMIEDAARELRELDKQLAVKGKNNEQNKSTNN